MVAKKKDVVDEEKLVADLLTRLFDLTGVPVSFDVMVAPESINVDLTSTDPALLIGRKGANLAALNRWLSTAIFNKVGDRRTVVVDIDNWRASHEDRLIAMARKLAQRAKFSHQPQMISMLTPAERRIIHTALTDNPDVETYSEGEGSSRYLVIKPRD